MKSNYDLLIIGGGPAGLAAAVSAKKNRIDDILVIERDNCLGGILNQCIHNGFGLHNFKEELTGPEYAQRYIDMVEEEKIPYLLNTMVVHATENKVLSLMNKEAGLFHVKVKAVILAMGCRERSRGALNIPGYRPAGIYSAGTAQRLMNIEGYMPGKEVVILGSGDIGLIMARRMTLEGAKVKLVAEILPYSGGLKRNKVQCLDDYGIPLMLSHTVVDIKGSRRIEGIVLAAVDKNLKPIAETEEYYSCDTLLLSVGLIPENEISTEMNVSISHTTKGPIVNESLMTNVEGIFACGNVLHVHDLVDYVSMEAENAGKNAADYILHGGKHKGTPCPILCKNGVRYTVPEHINIANMPENLTVRFRVNNIYKNCNVCVYCNDKKIIDKKKKIAAPGEMEQIILTRKMIEQQGNIKNITFCLENI